MPGQLRPERGRGRLVPDAGLSGSQGHSHDTGGRRPGDAGPATPRMERLTAWVPSAWTRRAVSPSERLREPKMTTLTGSEV